MDKLLSIVMPTFNRNQHVVENVRRLLPQLVDEEVELVILDNHSSIPIRETLNEKFNASDISRVKVVRNIANLGLAGNSLRTFEIGSGAFIWTLCDDDKVYPNAVASIIEAIKINLDCVYLWFPVQGGPVHSNPGRYAGIASAIKAEPNLFFVALSCCVFRRDFFSTRLRIGYIYSYTWAPFICPLLVEMEKKENLIYIGHENIAEAGPVDSDNKWSKLDVCIGIRSLLELPMSTESRKYLKVSIDSFSFSTFRLFLDSVVLNSEERWLIFKVFLIRRYFPFSKELIFWFVVSYIAQIFPNFTTSILKLLENATGRRLLLKVENRFERS